MQTIQPLQIDSQRLSQIRMRGDQRVRVRRQTVVQRAQVLIEHVGQSLLLLGCQPAKG